MRMNTIEREIEMPKEKKMKREHYWGGDLSKYNPDLAPVELVLYIKEKHILGNLYRKVH